MIKRILNKIDAFFMVAAIQKHGGKRKAAEALGISVDTINKYIEELEHEFGMRLVVSSSRGCCLTPFGDKIVEKTHSISEIVDSAMSEIPRYGEMHGTVNICMTTSMVPNLQMEDINVFMSEYPEINLNSIMILTCSEFANVDYDVGMCFDYVPDSNSKVVMYQRPIKMGLFASPDYLANYGYPRNIEDLQNNHRLVNKTNADKGIKVWSDLLKNARHPSMNSNSSYFLADTIRQGAGIGLLPERYKDKGLVCLDNFEFDITTTASIFADIKTKDIPRVRCVIEYLKTQINKM